MSLCQNKDFLREAIGKAILAPSGHNSQPWKFAMGEDKIILSPNYSRALPVADPQNRELFISIGCAIENIAVYAESKSLSTHVSILNDTAHITFTQAETAQNLGLANAINTRCTNRQIYNGKTISEDNLNRLDRFGVIFFANGSNGFKKTCESIELANNLQMGDNRFKQELKDWMRYSDEQAKDCGDGLSYSNLGAPEIPVFLRKTATALALNGMAQNRSDRKKLESSSHLAIFTGNDSIEEWINTGRKLERFLLTAETLGIACSYMNQPCEVHTTREMLQKSLQLTTAPQLILRLGYSPTAPHSPRRNFKILGGGDGDPVEGD